MTEAADEEKSERCSGGSCMQWRLAAAPAAVTTWSGHLHIALGTRPPVEIRDNRRLYGLRVRNSPSPALLIDLDCCTLLSYSCWVGISIELS